MKTLQDLVLSLENKDFAAAIWYENEHRHTTRSEQLVQRIRQVSGSLAYNKLGRGDRVAIFANNHHEWLTAALSVNYAGLVDVPRGTDTTDAELKYILEHSGAKAVFAQDQNMVDRVKNIAPVTVKNIFSFESTSEQSVGDLEREGKSWDFCLRKAQPDDLASIIYTSGTTGSPKGVMLSHENYVSNVIDLQRFLGDISNDKFLSVIPPWHAFGRGEKHLAIAGGAEVVYTNASQLMNDARAEKPSIIVSVPRLWETIYNKIQQNPKVENINKIPFTRIKQALVSYTLKKALGGNVRLIVSGGGGLPEHIDKFFLDHNIEILEGYGMTEMSPVISARTPGSMYESLGTVGKPMSSVQVEIRSEKGLLVKKNSEGIIFVNGPNKMLGYYKDEEETKKVIGEDGFLNTGDYGLFTSNHDIKITGRVKDEIALLNGENVQPVPLEEIITANKYIDQAMVVGEHYDTEQGKTVPWQRLGALIVPNSDQVKRYCQQVFHKDVSLQDVLHSHEVKEFLHKEVKKMFNDNRLFKSFEKVYDIYLVDAFTVGRELTQTYKLKRQDVLRQMRRQEIYSLGTSLKQC